MYCLSNACTNTSADGELRRFDGHTVVIAAIDSNDATRVASLLRQCTFSKAIRLIFYEGTSLPIDKCFASIVCDRPKLYNNLIKLPESLRSRRSIVLSDCDNEQSIINYLIRGARHVFSLNDSDRLLKVRLEAALRQHQNAVLKNFSVGKYYFDATKRQVRHAEEAVELSPKEYELARYLFSQEGKVVSNKELMTSVWSLPSFMDTRRIDTAACRIRKKLKLVPHCGWELKKIRCVGYRLNRVTADVIDIGSLPVS